MKDSGIEWIGQIPEGVNCERIKYRLNYVKGKNPSNINQEFKGVPYIGATDLDSENGEYIDYTEDNIPTCEEDDTLVLWDGARAGLVSTGKKGAIASTIVKVDVDERYIYKRYFSWYLKSFEKYLIDKSNGTTIPHMDRSYINELGLIRFPISIQQCIAEYLDKKCAEIDSIIRAKEKTNELLKEARQSIIYEAVTKGLDKSVPMKDSGIEWIGQIPQRWRIEKLKYNAILNPTIDLLKYELTDEDDVSFIPMENLKAGYHLLSEAPYGKVKKGYVQFENGDILLAKVTPCFENGNIAIATNLNRGVGFGSTEINVIRATKMFPKYLYYYFQNNKFIERGTFDMFGVAGLKRLTNSFLMDSYYPMPPFPEQQQIAEYLDKKCAEIDSVINANNVIIQKLKEYRQSVIYEAVTGKIEV